MKRYSQEIKTTNHDSYIRFAQPAYKRAQEIEREQYHARNVQRPFDDSHKGKQTPENAAFWARVRFLIDGGMKLEDAKKLATELTQAKKVIIRGRRKSK